MNSLFNLKFEIIENFGKSFINKIKRCPRLDPCDTPENVM